MKARFCNPMQQSSHRLLHALHLNGCFLVHDSALNPCVFSGFQAQGNLRRCWWHWGCEQLCVLMKLGEAAKKKWHGEEKLPMGRLSLKACYEAICDDAGRFLRCLIVMFHSLNPFTSYKLRVKATNDIGDSDFSAETEAVTTLQDGKRGGEAGWGHCHGMGALACSWVCWTRCNVISMVPGVKIQHQMWFCS